MVACAFTLGMLVGGCLPGTRGPPASAGITGICFYIPLISEFKTSPGLQTDTVSINMYVFYVVSGNKSHRIFQDFVSIFRQAIYVSALGQLENK